MPSAGLDTCQPEDEGLLETGGKEGKVVSRLCWQRSHCSVSGQVSDLLYSSVRRSWKHWPFREQTTASVSKDLNALLEISDPSLCVCGDREAAPWGCTPMHNGAICGDVLEITLFCFQKTSSIDESIVGARNSGARQRSSWLNREKDYLHVVCCTE